MVNYQNTQLYEIIEHDQEGNAHVYRGRTTQSLRKRLSSHRKDFKRWKEGKATYCSSFEVLKHGPARIEFIRNAPCFSSKEANRLEGIFIRELPTCVNTNKNVFNEKERRTELYNRNKEFILKQQKIWREAHKEQKKETDKKYYEKNKERLKNQNKEYLKKKDKYLKEKIICECGVTVSRGYQKKHEKSFKHIDWFIHC